MVVFRLDVQMHTFTVTGVKQGDVSPKLVTSQEITENSNLLNVMFETNPIGNLLTLYYGRDHNYSNQKIYKCMKPRARLGIHIVVCKQYTCDKSDPYIVLS